MENQINKLVVNFFKNINAKFIWNNEELIVESVPKEFENIIGRIPPYRFVFDEKLKTSQNSFINLDHNLIKIIARFLENSAKTTLLKINFEDKEIFEKIKRTFSWKNCHPKNLIKREKYNFFLRFTFQTDFGYLNKSEQLINEIYIHNEKIVEGNLNDYSVSEGNPKEISIKEAETFYPLALEKLKQLTKPKIEEHSKELKIQLESEVQRIKHHYAQEILDFRNNLEEEGKKIEELRKENKPENSLKIERIKQNIERIKHGFDSAKLKKEEKQFINHETKKYTLNIKNKLANTTLIYYPMFIINAGFANNSASSNVEIIYDPLTNEINKLFCYHCKKEIKEINLCSNGHVTCDDCLGTCKECGQLFCRSCLTNKCSICDKILCKNCSMRCAFCGKTICKNHSQKDKVSSKIGCTNCLKQCPNCRDYYRPTFFKQSTKSKKILCQKCISKEISESIQKDLFRN